MDDTAPDNILEVTARAITYYLDVSAECSRRIISVEGAVKALCSRLMVVDISSRTSKDLAEQCVKVGAPFYRRHRNWGVQRYMPPHFSKILSKCPCFCNMVVVL